MDFLPGVIFYSGVTLVLRVMVVHAGSMFGEGVTRLLAGAADIEVRELDPKNPADLMKAIRSANPDVVLLTRGTMDLPYASRLLLSLGSHAGLRVLILSEDDNLIHIFKKRQILVSSSSDLIDLILDG